MCRTAFRTIMKVSEKRLRGIEDLHKKNITNVASSMFYGRKRSERRDNAYGWLSNFIANCGDYMPHSKSIHLLHTLTKLMVYNTMKSQLLDQGIMPTDILKKSMFYTMWEEEFPECIIPKVRNTCPCTSIHIA